MDVEKLVREYLTNNQTRMMQVATSNDNKPWICTVYYAVDDDLNIYWGSLPDRRHSKDILLNPNIAVAIAYDQQPPQPYVRGIQIEGKAKLLTGYEAANAIRLYGIQLKSDPNWINDLLIGKDPHKFYSLKPSKVVLYDSKNFPDDSRKEWMI